MIPLVDLKAQYRALQPQIEAAVARVLASGQYVLGPELEAFEAEFARYSQARFAIGVNSGTSALHLALLAAGAGPGAEVITAPFTFVATVAAIRYTGARPVFVDVEPHTLTIAVDQIERAVTPRTRAILPVHLYGQPADLDPILSVARRHGLAVVEDAAQAHGAEYRGRRVGALGDLGCFSFYPGKNLGAYGEGGLVLTNNARHAETIRRLRNWGETEKGVHQLLGFNYRLDEVQAAILRVKLPHLESWTDARRQHAAQYDRLLAGTSVETPAVRDYARHVYHLYVIRSQRRTALRQRLAAAGIQTGIHYLRPVHLQPAFADLGYRPGDFPVSEQAAQDVLSLPMYPELSQDDIAAIGGVLAGEGAHVV